MTTCRCTAPQVNIWISSLAHCLSLNISFSLATYNPFLKSGPFSKEVSHFTTAVDVFYSSERLQIPLCKRLLEICTKGICRDQTQRCLLCKTQQKQGQKKSKEKHYFHRSVSKDLPHPSLSLMCVKLHFILWCRSCLPLIATYHAGWQDEASTNPKTLGNQVAETASPFSFHLVWVSLPAHHFNSTGWHLVFAAEQNKEVIAEHRAGMTVPAKTQQGPVLVKN